MKSGTDNLTTDYQCGGNWKSDFKPSGGSKQDDKKFKLEVDADGNITGKHGADPDRDGEEIISGTCSIDAATGKHRMQIRREDADNIYDYDGLITPEPSSGKFFIRNQQGTRKVTPKKKPFAQEPGEAQSQGKKRDDEQLPDDEWIAEKGT